MANGFKKYKIEMRMLVVDGAFCNVEDLEMYIDYRLNLRSRDSNGIVISDFKIEEINEGGEQMEMLK